jgi:hypothetical protein
MANIVVTDYRDSLTMQIVRQLMKHRYMVVNNHGNRRGSELNAYDCAQSINVVAQVTQPDRIISLLGRRFPIARKPRRRWVATITQPKDNYGAWQIDAYGTSHSQQIGQLVGQVIPSDRSVTVNIVEASPRLVEHIGDTGW